jgi:hypothetical protein
MLLDQPLASAKAPWTKTTVGLGGRPAGRGAGGRHGEADRDGDEEDDRAENPARTREMTAIWHCRPPTEWVRMASTLPTGNGFFVDRRIGRAGVLRTIPPRQHVLQW